MSTAAIPRIAVVAAGAMGSAVAKRLTKAGCTVYTNMDGRSDASRQRALDAGMIDVPLSDIVRKASWILSILPPRDAFSFAEKIRAETNSLIGDNGHLTESLVFADCNAVSPATVKRIAGLFESTSIKFIDAGIIGGPPTENYNPTFYASVDPKDEKVLDEFTALSKYGLKVAPLKGEGAGIGDASALKMSYAGISKGTTGLLTAMVLGEFCTFGLQIYEIADHGEQLRMRRRRQRLMRC
ncbi:hypothetical protein SERLA73DRAFT_179707 [Serpula lacrymans var. lacrymans S7.3]|uniref:6-phosphogluconate dehydrogenase NADP-binding domain-containing protein n=2 Tax=Serpula lacrymans var. lacrymans TaxID=341189 RepID=F8PTY9_SERL3|nr:uncharacterized protein SERLADRAFT_464941 [Serpula lacrymans var. lacrymans S7.9]EGN99614.1 hypothetical protein SERLA73DRAFT_179707 [Serpula lacrymans var. lacrymans S7.3]EGO25180.1 hypothetical protein SERLADRAFT_464941 [Serpula lacrymans var. lacrymans S7.9]